MTRRCWAVGTSDATSPGAGLWAGNGNANDSVGTDNGTAYGNITYASGHSGQAFNFDGGLGLLHFIWY